MGKLIRLELCNFKSYKGHHTLLFGDSYFTSIIGPNGSGKSNSMDAISFVLGIKSSHLRSSHLQELIYRGRVMKTSKINDDGSTTAPATNGQTNGHANGEEEESPRASRTDPKTAWVMAVYEDDAGDEQKWKRTITAQGSSLYHINDRQVTAAQYNQALEAENILIKARNFLVFQGDVETIASQSDQELTRLVEQISGSLEYKEEYDRLQKEAERAQENQNFKLHKRRGINSEIKQYQEQKREAENFQKKTEERDEAVVTYNLWKLYRSQQSMDEASAKIQEHQENLVEYRRNAETFEAQLEAARKEQAAVGREVSKIDRAIKQKGKDIELKDNELLPLNEKIAQRKQMSEKLKTKIDRFVRERNEEAEAIKRAEKQLAIVQKAEQKFEDDWKETMKQKGKEATDADRKEYETLQAKASARSLENKTRLDGLTRTLKGYEVTLSGLKGKVDASEAAIDKLRGDLEDLEERRDSTKDTVKQKSRETDEKKKEANHLQSETIRLKNAYTETDEKLQAICKRIEQAQIGREESAKETKLKETVSTLKRMYSGVRGRVGDLCKPKQKKFDGAVITALGRDFDSVVVDTEKVGLECVAYLKSAKAPPMTFIPLDNIKVSAPNSAVKGISGARLTIDTIEFDASIERAMSYACGSSVVCDNLDIAQDICYRKGIHIKAVTLDGFVISKAGLMTGGKLPEHKERGKKRQFGDHDLQNLHAEKEKLQKTLRNLPRYDESQEIALREEIVGLRHGLDSAKAELQAFERNVADKEEELEHEERQLRDLKPKYASYKGKLEHTQGQIAKIEKAIEAVRDKIFADFCKRLGYTDIRAYEAMQGDLDRELSEKRNKFKLQKEELQGPLQLATSTHTDLIDRLERARNQLERLKADAEGWEEEKAEIERAKGQDEDEKSALEESLEGIQAQHAEKVAKVAEAKQEVQKRNKEIGARLKAISALEAEVQQHSADRFALLRRCKLEQIQIPLAEGSLEDLPNEDNVMQQDPDAMDVDDVDAEVMAAALDNYGIEIDFDSLDEDLKSSGEDAGDKLQEKINSLTAELESLNPNMRAIERLEGVENRLKVIDKEFEDARAALRQAREAFNKVKARRFELFNRAYEHIKEQIVAVYKDLTRSEAYPIGGNAFLDIEDDTDTPYLSGIKYHTMPPLKRFRDMEHLSGGEKTIAALALLFAIHSYQPSPFFVLDEVDAALDNANVEHVKRYMREHAGPGMQFIVISLKASLFQDSESLIGVYRDQEVNSSKTLTLDLRKYS